MWKIFFLLSIIVLTGILLVNNFVHSIPKRKLTYDAAAETSTYRTDFILMSYNLHGLRDRLRLHELAQYVKKNQVDFLALQDIAIDSTGNTSQILSEELAGSQIKYPMYHHELDGLTTNLAFFSRFPIHIYEKASDRLQKLTAVFPRYGFYTFFNWQAVSAYHACMSTREVLFPAIDLLNNSHHVIMGDFSQSLNRTNPSVYPRQCDDKNTQCEETSPCLDKLNENYVFTCQNDSCPFVTDYIALPKNLDSEIINYKVDTQMKISDTLPVIATMRIKKAARSPTSY